MGPAPGFFRGAPMPRNVLFILSDEFRADALCGGQAGVVKTPYLDALAGEGVLFRNALCQAAPCAPSRMSLHTGRYMCSTGVVDNMTPLAEPEDNLGQWLSRHGVGAGIAGYNDYAVPPALLPEGHPHRSSLCYDYFLPGYEVVLDHEYDSPEWYAWLVEKGYPPEWCNRDTMYEPDVPESGPGRHLPCFYPARYREEHSEAHFLTGKALDYMTARAGEGWFLNLNYIKPHGPYIAAKEYLDQYPPEAMPPPVREERELLEQHPYFSRMENGAAKRHYVEDHEWRDLRRCYCAMATEIDDCVGRLVDYLKSSGQWENTLVIFGADHGSCLGDHYLQGKPHFYDSSIRVPFIIHNPGPDADATRGVTLDYLAENVDVAPTVCAFLGIPPHPRFQGRSLMPLLRGEKTDKTAAFFEYYYHNQLADPADTLPAACRLWVCRTARWKYVEFGEEEMPPMLFDLENDPSEFNNLAANPGHAPVMLDLARELIRWRIRNEDLRMEDWARPLR